MKVKKEDEDFVNKRVSSCVELGDKYEHFVTRVRDNVYLKKSYLNSSI